MKTAKKKVQRRTKAPKTQKSPRTNRRAKKGAELFHQVVRLTGIPSKTLTAELKTVLERNNIDIHHLTVDQLRAAVASYLREIMGNLLDKYGHKRTESSH